MPRECPSAVRTLLRCCLEKDPRKRIADISIVLFVLDEATTLQGPAEAGFAGRGDLYVRAADGTGTAERLTETNDIDLPTGMTPIDLNGVLFTVPVDARSASWSAGTPQRLFETQANYASVGTVTRMYDVAPDGERFLMVKDRIVESPPQIVVVQNWLEELKRLVPEP